MTYADAASTLALLIGAAGLWLHWQRWRADSRATRPVVTLAQVGAPIPLPPGWAALRLTLRSRDTLGHRVERVSIIYPLSGRIAAWKTHQPRGVNREPALLPPRPVRAMPLALAVRPAGNPPSRFRSVILEPGDAHSALLLVRRSDSILSRISSILRSRSTYSSQSVLISIDIRSEDDTSACTIRRICTITPPPKASTSNDMAAST